MRRQWHGGTWALLLTLGMSAPAAASTTLSLLDGTLTGVGQDSVVSAAPGLIEFAADAGGGQQLDGMVISDIGLNRLYVANSPTLPFADTATTMSGLSFWSDNLKVTGPGTTPVAVSVHFFLEGSYVGPCCEEDNPSSTAGNAYFLASSGRVLNVAYGGEDGAVSLETTLGNAILQGQYTLLPGGLLGVEAACDDDDGEDGCDPFNTGREFVLDFSILPDADFFIGGYVFVNDLAQGEVVDVFHTARLTRIDVASGFGLKSQSGRIVRRDDGSFGLPETVSGAVPEPASWLTMILGSALVGGAIRRRARVIA